MSGSPRPAARAGLREARAPIVAFVGPSGVGKTTLLEQVIADLARRGLRVAAIKHSHHDRFDAEGSDSARLRGAGSIAVALCGRGELAIFATGPEDPRALARLLPAADLVLCEGFKRSSIPKIEVHRDAVDRRFLASRDRRVIAVAGDGRAPRGLPQLNLEDPVAVADWLVTRLLPRRRPHTRAQGRRIAR